MSSHTNDRFPAGESIVSPRILLLRDDDPHRPSLENRVAYQGEGGPDLLGHRNGNRKDAATLAWMEEAVKAASGPAEVLDIGCAFGNLLLMLNARLGLPSDVTMWGVDLHSDGLLYGKAFAETVPGYSNCHYETADITKGLPFSDEQFNVANMGDVIEHLPDPKAALMEVRRVLKPGGILVLTTPLRDSLPKRAAAALNRVTGGKLKKAYYTGKGTELDAEGNPIMAVRAGHDHISEMTWGELRATCRAAGFQIEGVRFLPVLSGSTWFDRHPFLLAILLFIEAVHDVLRRPSWAHGVCLKLRKPAS